MEERISMVHGSGGAATSELIGSIFAKEFASTILILSSIFLHSLSLKDATAE